MANDKFNLDGFKVDKNDVCTADGGFVGDITGAFDESMSIASATGTTLTVDGESGLTLKSTGSGIVFDESDYISMPNLQTSDPVVAGALWNNSGVLSISAGS